MSWHFSQALEAAYLAANCLDGEPSAQSRSTPTASESSLPDKTMDALSPSRSGTTLPLSTVSHGAELLTWFLAASRAKESVAPATERDSITQGVGYGERWPAWFAKLDRATFSWKTPHLSLFEGWEPSSVIWPRWGMMQNGECSERLPLVPRISESDALFWPTLNCEGWRSDGELAMLNKLKLPNEELQALTHRACRSKKRRFLPTLTICGNYNRVGASPTSGDGLYTALGGRPNPEWEEWFMGWPIGATALQPLETAKFQQWFDSHGRL